MMNPMKHPWLHRYSLWYQSLPYGTTRGYFEEWSGVLKTIDCRNSHLMIRSVSVAQKQIFTIQTAYGRFNWTLSSKDIL